MKTTRVAATALLALLAAAPVFAHHSDVAYEKQAIELKSATIVNFAWKNPHGVVQCDVKDAKGELERWTLESGSPSAMMAVGWNKNSLVPGDVVTIDVNPAKNGTHFGRLLRVTKSDGKVLNYMEVVK